MGVGLAFLALGAYAFYVGARISSVFAIVIGAGLSGYSLLIPSEKQISRKVQKGIVGGFLELGKKKIDNGTVKMDLASFEFVVQKITPVISELSTMPELGFDSIYLHYQTEAEAEAALGRIKEESVSASVVQNKSEWAVKVEIPDHQEAQ